MTLGRRCWASCAIAEPDDRDAAIVDIALDEEVTATSEAVCTGRVRAVTDVVVPDGADAPAATATDGLVREEEEADSLSNMSKKAMSSSSFKSISAAKLDDLVDDAAGVPLVETAVIALSAMMAAGAAVIQKPEWRDASMIVKNIKPNTSAHHQSMPPWHTDEDGWR
jgi:hypothetical protein